MTVDIIDSLGAPTRVLDVGPSRHTVNMQWWTTYLLSPGFGGTAALLAAVVAGGIAWRNSAKDRRQRELAEQRSQWWDRFTWATEKAIDPNTSVVGSRVLNALVVPSLATAEDARMAIEISEIVDPPAAAVAEGGERQ